VYTLGASCALCRPYGSKDVRWNVAYVDLGPPKIYICDIPPDILNGLRESGERIRRWVAL
jgi:hypothetical protein